MKEEKQVKFAQKWIEDAVKKLLQKEEIYESDMEKIKYLRIGSNFNNGYMIELSMATPPDPFCDTDGGDEWTPGTEGGMVIGKFIQLFIDYMKENPFEYIDSYTGEHVFELSDLHFWDEYEEEWDKYQEECEELEEDGDGEDWKDIENEWKAFEKTILCEIYREKFDNKDAWTEWSKRVGRAIQQDMGLFTGLEVLRTQGGVYGEYQDMTFLRMMPRLRVWEVVETRFFSLEGIDNLAQLKQLSCWSD